MYVNIASDLISTQNILTLFELFSSTFGWSNDYIRYTLFDTDRDEPLIDEKFSYDATGKNAFLNANIVPLATGQHGDLNAYYVNRPVEDFLGVPYPQSVLRRPSADHIAVS
jgi:hypothetical protein